MSSRNINSSVDSQELLARAVVQSITRDKSVSTDVKRKLSSMLEDPSALDLVKSLVSEASGLNPSSNPNRERAAKRDSQKAGSKSRPPTRGSGAPKRTSQPKAGERRDTSQNHKPKKGSGDRGGQPRSKRAFADEGRKGEKPPNRGSQQDKAKGKDREVLPLAEMRHLATDWCVGLPSKLAALAQVVKNDIVSKVNALFKSYFDSWDVPRVQERSTSDWRTVLYWYVRERETAFLEVVQQFADACKRTEYRYDSLIGNQSAVAYVPPLEQEGPLAPPEQQKRWKEEAERLARSTLPDKFVSSNRRLERLSKAQWTSDTELQFQHFYVLYCWANSFYEAIMNSGDRIQGDEEECFHSNKFFMNEIDGSKVTCDWNLDNPSRVSSLTKMPLESVNAFKQSEFKDFMPRSNRPRMNSYVKKSGDGFHTVRIREDLEDSLPGMVVTGAQLVSSRCPGTMLDFASTKSVPGQTSDTMDPEHQYLCRVPNDKAFKIFRMAGAHFPSIAEFLNSLTVERRKICARWDTILKKQEPGNRNAVFAGSERSHFTLKASRESPFTYDRAKPTAVTPPWFNPMVRVPYRVKELQPRISYTGPVTDEGHVPGFRGLPVFDLERGQKYLALNFKHLGILKKDGSSFMDPRFPIFDEERKLNMEMIFGNVRPVTNLVTKIPFLRKDPLWVGASPPDLASKPAGAPITVHGGSQGAVAPVLHTNPKVAEKIILAGPKVEAQARTLTSASPPTDLWKKSILKAVVEETARGYNSKPGEQICDEQIVRQSTAVGRFVQKFLNDDFGRAPIPQHPLVDALIIGGLIGLAGETITRVRPAGSSRRYLGHNVGEKLFLREVSKSCNFSEFRELFESMNDVFKTKTLIGQAADGFRWHVAMTYRAATCSAMDFREPGIAGKLDNFTNFTHAPLFSEKPAAALRSVVDNYRYLVDSLKPTKVTDGDYAHYAICAEAYNLCGQSDRVNVSNIVGPSLGWAGETSAPRSSRGAPKVPTLKF
jgi:hypothetical protein